MKKYQIVFFLALVLTISILCIKSVIRSKKQKVYQTQIFQNANPRRKNVNMKLHLTKIDTCKGAFRFDIVDSFIYLFKEKETVVRNLFKNSSSKVYNYESVYNVFKTNDTINFFSVNGNYLIQNFNTNGVKKIKFNFFGGNIVKLDSMYYFTDTLSPPKNAKFIEQAIKNSSGVALFNLTQHVGDYLKSINIDSYKMPYSVGKLYNYSTDTILFMYSNVDLLVLLNIRDGKTRILKTNAKYNFIPYKELTINDPTSNNITFTKFETSIEVENIQSSISTNKKYIFIQQDFLVLNPNKEPIQLIDVYTKHNFDYLMSIPFKMTNKEEFLLDVRCNDKFVYVLTSLGNIYSLPILYENFN